MLVHSMLCAAAVLVESSNIGACGGEIETRNDLDPTLWTAPAPSQSPPL